MKSIIYVRILCICNIFALSIASLPMMSAHVVEVAGEEIEVVPDTDPRYVQAEQEFAATFGTPDSAVDASPKLEMGPIIRKDADGKHIVTFKAAAKECAQYAIAPSDQALKDNVEIQFVTHDRLPDNHKWKYSSEKQIFTFPFKKPVTLQYNDAGYKSAHGSSLKKDTNHNWGFRLLKNGKLVSSKADYEKYVRHMVASNADQSNLATEVSSEEAELLIKWGLVDQEFKQNVLDPLRLVAGEISQQMQEQQVGASMAFTTWLALTAAKEILLQVGIAVGGVYFLKGLVSFGRRGQAACDARKSNHQSSDLRDVVILAR